MGSQRVTLRAGEGDQERLPSGTGRLLAAVAWLVLLLGLWLWGGGGPDGVPAGTAGPVTGDMAAAGRPPRPEPAAVNGAAPRRLDIPALGIQAPVVARDLDEQGALKPAGRTGSVAWYADGAAPGASGTALMAGPAGTGAGVAAGQEIRVVRADGEVVTFTVEDVRAAGRDAADARQISAPPGDGRRAGLRLITCGGSSAPAPAGACTAPVIVSAYPAGA
ncbi:class F sortase [Streptomyces sp. CHD11]|uniref:sortase domain-containing protein n=1 Tax=Streptomyces sp. CHD11 TaxID=2741325 RepID=UPI001BFC208A|nr:sortase [Streptomyces sp. CHD11]MBT3151024.1 class F sortase [Streptomyces sp. CHD11]